LYSGSVVIICLSVTWLHITAAVNTVCFKKHFVHLSVSFCEVITFILSWQDHIFITVCHIHIAQRTCLFRVTGSR